MFVYLLKNVLFFSVVASLHCRPTFTNAWLERTDSVQTEKLLWLLLMMDILKKPLVAQYWSKNPLYSTPVFGSVIEPKSVPTTVVDATLQRQHPATVTWRPTPRHIVQTSGGSLVYSMSQNVCIEESLLLCKGCLHFKQYISIKRSRFGVKVVQIVWEQ